MPLDAPELGSASLGTEPGGVVWVGGVDTSQTQL